MNQINIANKINYVLNNYKTWKKENHNKVNSGSEIYKFICNEWPHSLQNVINNDAIRIKGSVGQGNIAEAPWICIMNKKITSTVQKGIYLGFLFKCDMSGFYLTLSQGWTLFVNKFGQKNGKRNARIVTNWFRNKNINEGFSLNDINLASVKSSLANGYEKTTILSKFYEKEKFTYEEILKDLRKMVQLYDEYVDECPDYNYEKVVDSVLALGSDNTNFLQSADDARQEINETLQKEGMPITSTYTRMREIQPEASRKPHKYRNIQRIPLRKVDYLEASRTEMHIGNIGEEKVLTFEQEKLIKMGRNDLADQVKRVSIISDYYGYDIKSYGIDKNGEPYEIYIEVKTTKSKTDTVFFVSKNEVETSKKYKNKYCLFRIYDIFGETPKFYRKFGAINDNFEIDPITFAASLK